MIFYMNLITPVLSKQTNKINHKIVMNTCKFQN